MFRLNLHFDEEIDVNLCAFLSFGNKKKIQVAYMTKKRGCGTVSVGKESRIKGLNVCN